MCVNSSFNNKVTTLINLIQSQFAARTTYQARKSNVDFKNCTFVPEVKNNTLYFTLVAGEESHIINVPLPYEESGIVFITSNEVKRAVSNYFDVTTNRILDYLDIIQNIFIGDYSNIVTTVPIKKAIFIQQLAHAIINNNISVVVYNLQKAINEVVNTMPLHETMMNSWLMNNRLIIIDPDFNTIVDPAEKLHYQIEKNKKYFEMGWTSIGLSDGSLASKNYILTEDLKRYTPFGMYHHNPQRNLYSTLGMDGDELPRMRTVSTQNLLNKGVTRKGWNWFTAYVDVPGTFEDQIIVDKRHATKFITRSRKIQCFGKVLVKKNQKLKYKVPLSIHPDGKIERYTIRADKSWVEDIHEHTVIVGGCERKLHTIVIKLKRNLKYGTKITNTHGNKGIIRLEDLGYAIDPITRERRKIDVIVSAKTIKKRKNYGQILEALLSDEYERIHPNNNDPIVLPDDYKIDDINIVKDSFKTRGFNDDLTWSLDTYVKTPDGSPITAVCGTVFWGVIKDPEDQLWDNDATITINNNDLRTAGLKFSTVEFRALETRFGQNNAIMNEILTYTQGITHVKEMLKILQSKTGVLPKNVHKKSVYDVQEVDQSVGTMFTEEQLKNTVADDSYYNDGFILQLPVLYQTAIGWESSNFHEGGVTLWQGQYDPTKYKAIYLTNEIYVPNGILRRSWKHSSGLYGMSAIATLLNNIIVLSNRYRNDPENAIRLTMLYRSIGNYFTSVATMLGNKTGYISNYAMSVRYPFSVKAVAALNNNLPENTIEIHRDMANILDVANGDVVLVERFPCLGFMGIRVQKVVITDNPIARYVISVSNNSLVSQNLDFDGDVIYVASFHSSEAITLLKKEWENPNEACWKYIDILNKRKGVPRINCIGIDDYAIKTFPQLSCEEHAKIVEKLTGVKSHTGPVIALAYNIMRLTENSGSRFTPEIYAGIEMFIEKTGQSVFEQKHGDKSLHDIVIDAICTTDVETLIQEGFDPKIVVLICDIIKNKAAKLGVHDLKGYHDDRKKSGGSNIVNRIIRAENKIYFASRSVLEATALLEALNSEAVDIPSRLLKTTFSIKHNVPTFLDKQNNSILLENIRNEHIRNICAKLFSSIDKLMGVPAEEQEKGGYEEQKEINYV